MKGKILVGIIEYRVLTLVLLLSFTLCSLFGSAVPAYSQSNSPPSFPEAAYLLRSSESTAPIRPVGVPLVATDPDPSDKVIYSLEGEDSSFFSIVESTGQMETRDPLDYETRATYLVTVKATDTGGRFDIALVNIEVTNIDEEGEVILTPTITNMGPGAHATLTDPDNNLSNVSWQWAGSYDQATWSDIEGAESPSFVPSEEDLRQFLRVTATYSDGHGPGKTAATLFDGNVLPVGNHPPEFPFSESGVRSTGANLPSGGKIGQPILASDLDRDSLMYWLSGEASLFFAIEPFSGQLRAKSDLDGNFTGRYFGKVHVFDGRGGNVTKEIRVDVGDIPAPAVAPAIVGEASSTRASSTVEEDAPKKDHGVRTATFQSAQSPADSSESDPGPDSTAKPETNPERPTRADITEARDPRTQGLHGSPAAGQSNLEVQEQAPPAMVESSPPSPSIGGAATSGFVPLGESDQEGTAGGSALRTMFTWVAWSSLCVLTVAGVLLMLLKIRRVNRREVKLPPPSFGPERRILS